MGEDSICNVMKLLSIDKQTLNRHAKTSVDKTRNLFAWSKSPLEEKKTLLLKSQKDAGQKHEVSSKKYKGKRGNKARKSVCACCNGTFGNRKMLRCGGNPRRASRRPWGCGNLTICKKKMCS